MRHWYIDWYLVALTIAAAGVTAPLAAQSRGGSDTNDTPKVITFNRELFQYTRADRRDPFRSLVMTSELRPTLADLRLTTIAYDPTGGNSVAVLRDLGTKAQYRVKIGSTLGRMRVVRIEPKVVTFALEEFGFSRQETLSLNDSTRTRTP